MVSSMIKRFLTSLTCSVIRTLYTAVLLVLIIGTTCFGQDRPSVGAIRWDAWQEDGTVNAEVETTLGNSDYHERIPWFGQVNPDDSVTIRGNSQAIMDQEITYAADAGLDYWAFVGYRETYGMSNAYNLYHSSSQKSRINFALNVQSNRLDSNWDSVDYSWKDRLLGDFADASYQKVQGDRPLVYIFNADNLVSGSNINFTSYAAVKSAFDDLRSESIAQGSGDPYIVAQVWNPSIGAQLISEAIADGIGRYAHTGGSYPDGSPYESMTDAAESNWDQSAATGSEVVPLASTGWDRRPRYDAGGVFWESGAGNPAYYEAPTDVELKNHLLDAISWVQSNPDAAAADTVLMYAWNEHDEGGWLSPTKNLDGSINTSRIDAIGEVLNASSQPPVTVPVSNGSFETVGTASNNTWQELPDGSGWGHGDNSIYQILDLAFENVHFPGTDQAPDGTRVLNLGAVVPLTADLNHSIEAGQIVTLTFYVGNSANQADPPGDITATITLDGADAYFELIDNDALDGEFVEKTVQWTATAGGDLGLKFTNTGSAWLDAVSVTVTTIPEPTSLLMLAMAGGMLLTRRRTR